MKTFKKSLLLLGVLVMAAIQTNAQTPAREFSRYIGESARSIDKIMRDEGYTHFKTDKSYTDSYSYWWNYRDKECVCARVNN